MCRSRSVRQPDAHPASRTGAERTQRRSQLGRPRGGVMGGGPGGEAGDGPEPAGGAPEADMHASGRADGPTPDGAAGAVCMRSSRGWSTTGGACFRTRRGRLYPLLRC
jgi:hypothetical protein